MKDFKTFDDFMNEGLFKNAKGKIEKTVLKSVFNAKDLTDIRDNLTGLQNDITTMQSGASSTADAIGKIYNILSALTSNLDFIINKIQ